MWPNSQFSADLVTFTEEILNGKLHFLCSNTFLFLDIKVCLEKKKLITSSYRKPTLVSVFEKISVL